MIPTLAFFNGQGGVGTTLLVYHLAWMYADLGYRVLAVDLDPQAGLTAAMVDVERLEVLWSSGGADTVHGAISPLIDGMGKLAPAHREPIAANLELIVGDLSISKFEDELASQWAGCLGRRDRAFRVTSAFHRCIQDAAQQMAADVVLVDLGPNLGPLNRVGLVACHHFLVPVAPDLFALQGLRSLGPVVRQWRDEWRERVPMNPAPELELESNVMNPAGYVVVQHALRLDRPMHTPSQWINQPASTPASAFDANGQGAQPFREWMSVIPDVYATATLGANPAPHPASDPHCLGLLKRYSGLLPMAEDARKPIFHLRPADGALGAYATAAQEARKDFKQVAERIAAATWQLGGEISPARARP